MGFSEEFLQAVRRGTAPGELHGVDVEESKVELARSLAETEGLAQGRV